MLWIHRKYQLFFVQQFIILGDNLNNNIEQQFGNERQIPARSFSPKIRSASAVMEGNTTYSFIHWCPITIPNHSFGRVNLYKCGLPLYSVLFEEGRSGRNRTRPSRTTKFCTFMVLFFVRRPYSKSTSNRIAAHRIRIDVYMFYNIYVHRSYTVSFNGHNLRCCCVHFRCIEDDKDMFLR